MAPTLAVPGLFFHKPLAELEAGSGQAFVSIGVEQQVSKLNSFSVCWKEFQNLDIRTRFQL